MVTPPGRTDPASCSQLGGSLRSSAQQLAQLTFPLRTGSPVASMATAVATELDAAGSALQAHAQELAEHTVALHRLTERISGAGLVLDGWRVREPAGPARAEQVHARRQQLEPLQEQVTRISARVARARAQLERTLAAGAEVLARASRAAYED